MPRPKRPVKPRPIPCSQCAREIPASAAKTAEGKDYALYFCGPDCSTKWKAAHSGRGANNSGE